MAEITAMERLGKTRSKLMPLWLLPVAEKSYQRTLPSCPGMTVVIRRSKLLKLHPKPLIPLA
jgi:hypothetical protein